MSANGSSTKIVSAQLPAELAGRLERVAAEEDRSVSSVVRRALTEHLDRPPTRVHVPDHERQVA